MDSEFTKQEEEWLWAFQTLAHKLAFANDEERKQLINSYCKKAEGVDIEKTINIFINGLKQRYNM